MSLASSLIQSAPYLIGGATLIALGIVYFINTNRISTFLSAKTKFEWKKVKLKMKIPVSPDTFIFRFDIGSQTLGLPTGYHISLAADVDMDNNTKRIQRAYTPISPEDTVGYFDLIVRVYGSKIDEQGNIIPHSQGKLGNYLHNMAIGESIDIKGPSGRFNYSPNKYNAIGMIAGGTGITPMLAIARKSLKDTKDKTKISLIFANQEENQILMRKELGLFAKKHHNQFNIFYTLDRPSENWSGGSGFVTADMITENLPSPNPGTIILLCGPPPMIKFMKKLLEKLGYTKDMIFIF